MRAHRVRALLMGGQACVFYGAAEFSRDTDFAILADAANLARLRKALAELRAEPIAVPPFELKYLRRGRQDKEYWLPFASGTGKTAPQQMKTPETSPNTRHRPPPPLKMRH
ncbi:MAG TPA: hypothetical protein VH595_22095 [Verrucomicrobiae bacterium]|jgi:hypothetical protein|nr:hypothetical protein [Verrucomicrobiae bacterium]